MSLSWTLDTVSNVNNFLRESFHSTTPEGTLYRESLTVLDPQSTKGRMTAYSEAQCYIPGATGPLMWTLESTTLFGEKMTQIYSAAAGNSQLYLNLTIFADPYEYNQFNPGGFPKYAKLVEVGLSYTPQFNKSLMFLPSNPSVGSSTMEQLIVPGLQASDMVVSVLTNAPGANAAATINGWGAPNTNVIPVNYTAAPGPGLRARVIFLR